MVICNSKAMWKEQGILWSIIATGLKVQALLFPIFSQDSDLSDVFSAAPNASDVFFLLCHTLLDTSVDHILLGDFNLHHPL